MDLGWWLAVHPLRRGIHGLCGVRCDIENDIFVWWFLMCFDGKRLIHLIKARILELVSINSKLFWLGCWYVLILRRSYRRRKWTCFFLGPLSAACRGQASCISQVVRLALQVLLSWDQERAASRIRRSLSATTCHWSCWALLLSGSDGMASILALPLLWSPEVMVLWLPRLRWTQPWPQQRVESQSSCFDMSLWKNMM